LKYKNILLFAILVVIATLPAEAQCAMCRAVLDVGGIGYMVYRNRQKEKAKEKP